MSFKSYKVLIFKNCIYQSIHGFGGKPGGKRLGKPRQRWEDTIKMNLKDIGWECVDLIHLSLDRGKWQVMNILVP